MYGVIRGGDTSDWLSAEVAGSLAAAVVLIAALLWYEQRVDNPALDVRLFSRPAFSASIAGGAVSFFAIAGGTFFLVFYVQGILGNSPLELGPTAAGTVVSAILSSGLARKFGVRATVAAGLLLLVTSFVWLCTLERTTALWQLEIMLALSGAGLGLVMGTTTTSIMSIVPADKGGAGAAVNSTMRQVGAAIGVAVLGSVLSLRYRAELGTSTDALPADLRAQAGDSLGSTTRAVTQTLQRPGLAAEFQSRADAVIIQAQNAFIQAMHASALIGAGALALGFLVALRWLRAGNVPDGDHQDGVLLVVPRIVAVARLDRADVPAGAECVRRSR